MQSRHINPLRDCIEDSARTAAQSYRPGRASMDTAAPQTGHYIKWSASQSQLHLSEVPLAMARPASVRSYGSSSSKSNKIEKLRQTFRSSKSKRASRRLSLDADACGMVTALGLEQEQCTTQSSTRRSRRFSTASFYSFASSRRSSMSVQDAADSVYGDAEAYAASVYSFHGDANVANKRASIDSRRHSTVSFNPTARSSSLAISADPACSSAATPKRPDTASRRGAIELASSERAKHATCYEQTHAVEKALKEAFDLLERLTVHGVRPSDSTEGKTLRRRLSLPFLSSKKQKLAEETVSTIPRKVFSNAAGFCFITVGKKSSCLATVFSTPGGETLSSPLFLQAQCPEGFARSGGRVLFSRKDEVPSHVLLVINDPSTLDLFRRPTCGFQSSLQCVAGPTTAAEHDDTAVYSYGVNLEAGTLQAAAVDLRRLIFTQDLALLESFYRLANVEPSDVLDAHYRTPVAARNLRLALQRAIGSDARRHAGHGADSQPARPSLQLPSAPVLPPRSAKRLCATKSDLSLSSSFALNDDSRTVIDGNRSRSSSNLSTSSTFSSASTVQPSEASTPEGSQRSASPVDVVGFSSSDANPLIMPVAHKLYHSPSMKHVSSATATNSLGNTTSWISQLRRSSDASQYSVASGLSRVTEASEYSEDEADDDARQVAAEAGLAIGLAAIIANNRHIAWRLEHMANTGVLPPAKPPRSPLRPGSRPSSGNYTYLAPALDEMLAAAARRPRSNTVS